FVSCALRSQRLRVPAPALRWMSEGKCFFVHGGRGLAKLDQTGKRSYIRPCTGGHWLCLDPNGSFSRTQPKHFDQQVNRGHAVPSFQFPVLDLGRGGTRQIHLRTSAEFARLAYETLREN